VTVTVDNAMPYSKFMIFVVAGITVFLWGSVYAALRITLQAFAPGEIAFIRTMLASIVLACYAISIRMPMPNRKFWPAIAGLGITGFALYSILLNEGQKDVNGATASIILNSTPAIAAVLALKLLRERLGKVQFCGIAISFAGVITIVLSKTSLEAIHFTNGAVLLVLAACVHALHFVLQKPLLRNLSAPQLTLGSVIAGFLALTPYSYGALQSALNAPAVSLIAVFYLGVFSSGIGYLTWAHVLSRLPASTATPCLSLIPVVALLLDALIFGEFPTVAALCGGIFTVSGTLLVQRNYLSRAGLAATPRGFVPKGDRSERQVTYGIRSDVETKRAP
jgi:drug/metabolite transporter (DMT)-like permease